MALPTVSVNTQPIYPRTPLHWRLPLKAEVCPRIPTTQVPILVGQATSNGSLIHGIEVQPLGDNVKTVLRLYTQASLDMTPNLSLQQSYQLLGELDLPATTASNETTAIARIVFPLWDVLPAGNKALHLANGETLYAALGTAVATGFMLYVRGGHY